jgi:hypothetical protein
LEFLKFEPCEEETIFLHVSIVTGFKYCYCTDVLRYSSSISLQFMVDSWNHDVISDIKEVTASLDLIKYPGSAPEFG